MKQEDQNILRHFQQEPVRAAEQDFACVLTERSDVNVFFINENEAFTDGKMIVADPAADELFTDEDALFRTEEWLEVPHQLGDSRWLALGMITRSQIIHECLHILYSVFPVQAAGDERGTTKVRRTILALIANIVEDAFIEAAGCSAYDNIEMYLLFGRVSRLYCHTPSAGTAERRLRQFGASRGSADEAEQQRKGRILTEYLNYMATDLLYPMLRQQAPGEEFAQYVRETHDLFHKGMFCGDPKERFGCCQQIFDKIEELIPDCAEELDDSSLKDMLGGTGTHSFQNASIANYRSEGKAVAVSRGLFFDSAGNEASRPEFKRQWMKVTEDLHKREEALLKIVLTRPQVRMWNGNQYDCAVIHHKIQIKEDRPPIDLNLAKAYQNIFDKYRMNINSYNSRFAQLLKGEVSLMEEKLLIGSHISSKHLADYGKRYWSKRETGYNIPELAVLILIDGSGSMEGKRCDGARRTCVILHEVLRKQGIQHAIVEHRAIPGEYKVDCNILVDFYAREEEKYNILRLDASGNTREGLVLFWAENYLNKGTSAEHRLILVISDGLPCHYIEEGYASYEPPVSTMDTANAARKIVRRGTDIIAVALDDADVPCYVDLKQIYPSVISCTDLNRLTGQVLGVITKRLQQQI